jgi:hypothetical protein
MVEEKSWSQRSLEEADQRKSDYNEGYRTGCAFNNESRRGASAKESGRRHREAWERHVSEMSMPINTGYDPPAPTYNKVPMSTGALSTGGEIAARLNHILTRLSPQACWVAGTIIAFAGYGLGLSEGATNGTAAIVGVLLVAGIAIGVKFALFLLGLAAILIELAINMALVCAVLFFGCRWLHTSGYF